MVALAQHPQTQFLNRTTVRFVLDANELVVFCPGWQTLDYVESHLVATLHCLEIMGKQRGTGI
jgi:hypothetical protein